MIEKSMKVLLKEAKLTKKELSEIFSLSYGSVRNWGTSVDYPYWFRSWIENYIKAKKYDELMDKIREES